jgi:hypothetical protein
MLLMSTWNPSKTVKRRTICVQQTAQVIQGISSENGFVVACAFQPRLVAKHGNRYIFSDDDHSRNHMRMRKKNL